MNREKMICSILLLINLTSCVCGTFVVNVTQSSYQAEENHNITLEWTFTTRTPSSHDSLSIHCELLTGFKTSTLFDLHEGVEVPESQDQQFAGRVQCDKDVLREGRIRLHVSRLRIVDSGLYLCEVRTDYGGNYDKSRLSVKAARDWPKPETEPERPNTASRGRIGFFWRLVLAAAAGTVMGFCSFAFIYCLLKKKHSGPMVELIKYTVRQFEQQCK